MIFLKRAEIEARIDQAEAARTIESCFRAVGLGNVNLPPVGHITFPDVAADCHIKFGHIKGEPIFVIKVATGFPQNAPMGLPTNNGLVLVLSANNGELKAILHDEMILTSIRTGIAGAIASKVLARRDSKQILIVGTGIQAQWQIKAHAAQFGPDAVFKVWGRSTQNANGLVEQMSSLVDVSVAPDLGLACRDSDIIVTTTATQLPIIESGNIMPGTHISAIGADAPGKQELENALVARADLLVADLSSQSLDHGEFSTPCADGLIDAASVVDLGSVSLSPERGRANDEQISIVDMTGLAALDIAMAGLVLK